MDGEAHLHRKALFLSQLNQDNQIHLARIIEDQWNAVVPRWVNAKEINLFEEAKSILCKSACIWAGVPLPETEIKNRAEGFASMVDAFGAVGPRHWVGRTARSTTEEWIKTIIENVRLDRHKAPEDSALFAMAFHRELDGKLLDSNMAAIELINILRPIIGFTIEIMKVSLDFLVNKIEFNVPEQDLSYDMDRIPTFPKSGFIMNKINC